MNNQQRNQNQDNGIGTLIIAGFMAISFVVVVGSCFIPAFASSYFLKKTRVRLTHKSDHLDWIDFWSAIFQLSLYAAGFISLYSIFFFKGSLELSNFISRAMILKTWNNSLAVVSLISLPSLICYMIKVSDYYRDIQSNDILYFFKPVKKYIMIMTFSLISFPLSFLVYGIAAKKISWIVSFILYILPLIVMVIMHNNGVKTDSLPYQIVTLSGIISYLISLIHSFRIKGELLDRINSSNVVHIVNEKVA